MTSPSVAPETRADKLRGVRVGLVGLGLLAVILVAGLAWAKWLPYLDKASALDAARSWADPSIFTSAGRSGSAPTFGGAWSFTLDYFDAVWRALLVAVLVAAAVDALVPRRWLVAVLDRRTRLGQSLVGGTLSLPSMMCTCCTAPVAVGLRRRGVPLSASIAYWLGNPLLNPAVLVFLFFVLPWQYSLVRLGVGLALVIGASALVPRLANHQPELVEAAGAGLSTSQTDPASLRELPTRYLRSLLRLALVLLPEYVVVVFVLGLLSGWLSDFADLEQHIGAVALVLAAVVATCLVIPTGGEIPVIVAVLAAGGGSWLGGVLLIALPAVALPSIAMVGRVIGWRVTWVTTGTIALGSLVAGGMVAALS